MAKPSTPTLLLMVVRFFTPLRTRARSRFSGTPHKPKPPTMIVAPSGMSRTASSALATSLFIAEIVNKFQERNTFVLCDCQNELRCERGIVGCFFDRGATTVLPAMVAEVRIHRSH